MGRSSAPTVAVAETSRQVQSKPVSDAGQFAPGVPKLASGSVHVTNSVRTPTVSMNPTHSYASGMQSVHVSHKA